MNSGSILLFLAVEETFFWLRLSIESRRAAPWLILEAEMSVDLRARKTARCGLTLRGPCLLQSSVVSSSPVVLDSSSPPVVLPLVSAGAALDVAAHRMSDVLQLRHYSAGEVAMEAGVMGHRHLIWGEEGRGEGAAVVGGREQQETEDDYGYFPEDKEDQEVSFHRS